MNKLTAFEKRIINNLTQVHDPNVKLGDKIDEIIGLVGESGSPVNAVNAAATLNITGVAKDGNTVSIGDDVYEFMTDAAQTKTAPSNIAVDISGNSAKAAVVLTMDTQPTSGDTITIGGRTYIFVPVGTDTGVGEVSIGADLAGAQDNLVAAINGTVLNPAHTEVTAGAFAANASTITALIGGTAGNSIVSTETFTATTNVFAATTLLGGTDCTAANAATALVAAITAHDTQGVGAVKGTDGAVTLSADVAGTAANAIGLAADMFSAAFAESATTLLGGIDGTVALGTKFMMDESYLYVCPEGNAVSQKNWRRISLGTAY